MPGKQNKLFGKPGNLIAWFLMLSLMVHIAVFSLQQPKAKEALTLSISSPLQVTIVSTRDRDYGDKTPSLPDPGQLAQPGHPLEMKQAGAPIDQLKTERNQIKPAHITAAAAPTNSPATEIIDEATEKHSTTNEAMPAEDHPGHKTINANQLQQQLYSLIRARFTYPLLAQRMGWQGLVSLTLRIENDGSLNNVRVTHTSGYQVLDDNARKTIQGIGKISIAALESFEAVNTNVDVLYRLTE